MRPRLVLLAAALAAALLVAGGARAQTLSHHSSGPPGRTTQTVDLVDAWGDGPDASAGRPRDVLARVTTRRPAHETTIVHLLLFGAWGAHAIALEESSLQWDDFHARSARIEWRALDIDADEQNEIVIVERRVETRVPFDEDGSAMVEAGRRFADHAVKVHFLDRTGNALVDRELIADPKDPGFALLLLQDLPGSALAALQLAAADLLFARGDYEAARYRYQVALEWAERELSARERQELSVTMDLPSADPDEPAFLWIASRSRYESLPPFYQRP